MSVTFPVNLAHNVRIDHFGGEWKELVRLVEKTWPIPSQEYSLNFVREFLDTPESRPYCVGVYHYSKLIGFSGGFVKQFRVAGQSCKGIHFTMSTLSSDSPVSGLMLQYINLGTKLMKVNGMGVGIYFSSESKASVKAIQIVTSRLEGYTTFTGNSMWSMALPKSLSGAGGKKAMFYKGGKGKYFASNALFNDGLLAYDWNGESWDFWYANSILGRGFAEGEMFLGGIVSGIRTAKGLKKIGIIEQVSTPSPEDPELQKFIMQALVFWAQQDELDMIYFPVHNSYFPDLFKNLKFILMPRKIPHWFSVKNELVSDAPARIDWKRSHINIV